jgi:hypothetical protein
VVTVCALRLALSSTFSPHSIFMCFVWVLEQTAIISLYSVYWLVFINVRECVYCAVRTGSLNVVQVNFICKVLTESQEHSILIPS